MTDEELLEAALRAFRRHPKATWQQQRAAMAFVGTRHVDTRPGRITRIKALADAIEAKEIAE